MKSKFYLCDVPKTLTYHPQALGILSSNPSIKCTISFRERLANLEIRKYTGYSCLVVNSSIAYDEAVELLLKERVLMYNKYYVTDDDQSWSIKDYGDMAIAHTTIISNPSENMYNVHLKNIRKHVSDATFEMCKRFCDVFEIERVTFTPISQEEVLIQALPSPLRPFPHVYIMLTPTKYSNGI
jgi:hypothetical protein